MKKLKVYAYNSHFTYEDLYVRHTYKFTAGEPLIIYDRDEVTGEEHIHAVFREWDYFKILED